MDFSSHRLNNLARGFAAEELDAFLVTSPTNITYLLGTEAGAGYLVVMGKKNIFVTTRVSTNWETQSPALEVRRVESEEKAVEAVGKLLGQAGAKLMGIEANHLTVGQSQRLADVLPKVQLKPMAGTVERLRAAKDPGEVEAIRAVAQVLDRAWMMFAVMVRETDTEPQLLESAIEFVRRAGGRLVPDLSRITLGANTANPEAETAREEMTDVSKVTFDVTARATYHSRLVRSLRSPFPVAPSRKNKQERVQYNYDRVFDAVCAAHDAIIAQVREGITVGELHVIGREALLKPGFTEALAPNFGHGIGLEPTESPVLREGSKEVLTSGMVLHIAPRLDFPGWGGVSLGEDYFVSGNRAIRLGKANRRPLVPG